MNEQKSILIIVALISFLLGGVVASGIIYYTTVSIINEADGIFSGVQVNTTIQFNETKIAELINSTLEQEKNIKGVQNE